MKSKIVLWGTNAADEKVLLAASLRADDNKVDIWVFPEEVATEEFYEELMKNWRSGAEVIFPENKEYIERELSVTDSILPEHLKAERNDVIHRAQTEWHFVVLSSKLHKLYESELAELKEKVEQLESYDANIWSSLKEYWDKLQTQVQEQNLLREHADALRNNANALFSKMKKLRSKLDEEVERLSKEAFDSFMEALDKVEAKISEGGRFASIFDELKKLQNQFKESTFTREHRNQIWDKLNSAFKSLKNNRFGSKGEETNSQHQRLKRRYEGLIAAITRMDQSIKRDRNDLIFQQRKIDNSLGQLEAQIRQAKIIMIEERIKSKEEKLQEMLATKVELESRLKHSEEREARREAEEHIKEKIAGEIRAAAVSREQVAEKLEKAAEEIAASKKKPKKTDTKPKQDSLLDAASTTIGESFEDLIDSIAAVGSVVAEKIEDGLEKLKDEIEKETGIDLEELVKSKEDEPEAENEPKEENDNKEELKS